MRSQEAQTLLNFYCEAANVHQLMTAKAERSLSQNLTMAQFMLLDYLRQCDEAQTPMQIAQKFRLTKGAVTNLIGQLRRKEMIGYKAHPNDGRSKLVALTLEGITAHRHSMQNLSSLTSEILTQFSPSEFAQALPALEQFSNWLNENKN